MQTQPSPVVLLVPLDGSEAAGRALRYAMRVAVRERHTTQRCSATLKRR
jgi:hypothetical protein